MNEQEKEIYKANLLFETNQDIAKRLGISEEDVELTVANMREKFKVMNSSEELKNFLKEIGMTTK